MKPPQPRMLRGPKVCWTPREVGTSYGTMEVSAYPASIYRRLPSVFNIVARVNRDVARALQLGNSASGRLRYPQRFAADTSLRLEAAILVRAGSMPSASSTTCGQRQAGKNASKGVVDAATLPRLVPASVLPLVAAGLTCAVSTDASDLAESAIVAGAKRLQRAQRLHGALEQHDPVVQFLYDGLGLVHEGRASGWIRQCGAVDQRMCHAVQAQQIVAQPGCSQQRARIASSWSTTRRMVVVSNVSRSACNASASTLP